LKRSPQVDKAFIEQQNKVRGVISEFKSRKFVKDRPYPSSSRLRLGLRESLLDARVALHPSQFDSFLGWLDHQIEVQLPGLNHLCIGYEELAGVITDAPVTTLERELLWITARIKKDSTKLNIFREAVEGVERLIFCDRVEEAIEATKAIETAFGVSMWSVQLRIALEHQAGGLERQKRFTAEVRSVYRRGLLGFTAYHTSVRNEDRSSLAKYCDDIKKRIDKHQYYQPFVKTYARYRLAGELPSSESGLADILRVEQSHSSIDVYETFVCVAQELVRREDLVEARNVLVKCLNNLSGMDDFRLFKAALCIGQDLPWDRRVPSRSTLISDPLLQGDCKRAVRSALTYVKAPATVDPWQFIYAGVALAHAMRRRGSTFSRPRHVSHLIGGVLSRGDGSYVHHALLGKLMFNLRALPVAAGVLDLLPMLRPSRPDEPWRPWLIGLNSSTIGAEDFSQSAKTVGLCRRINKSFDIGPTEAGWQLFNGFACKYRGISSITYALFTGVRLLREGEYQQAADTLTAISEATGDEPVRAMAASMLLHAYTGLGDRPKVIKLIADEGARSEANRALLPVKSALEHFEWADYKAVSHSLVPPIALQLLWADNENDTTASYMRFATGAFLRWLGVERPSKLYDLKDAYPRHQLIYFLREVCVLNVLDVTRVLKNSREVLEERQAICEVLRLLDTAHSQEYLEEILSISNTLAMDDGQWIVDGTRVYVDTDALTRWAAKELSEDYARFRDLLGVEIGTRQSFDDVLKELATASPSQRSTYDPENEADAVLVSILRRLGDEFLNNPSFGFDFYLSKRIRHQSFVGLIRGPLEFAGLITTRESGHGGYHRNDCWLEKFSSISAEAKEALNDALAEFARTFDDTLIDAKDNRFHVLSHENPRGLLFLDLTQQLIALARALVQMDTTPQEFVKTTIALLWAALETSLAIARRFICEELKTKIAESFDELRAAARKFAEHDPALLELDMEIGRCSTEVQRALDDVATWFSHADTEANKRYFRLEQIVDIAIDSTLKCQRAFEPDICREVEGDLELSASNLVFVHDVVFVALTNARAHSGYKSPKVRVFVHADLKNGTLSVEVTSDARPQGRASQEEAIREIRQLIDGGYIGRRTRSENRSGFLKLAAVVRQTSKGKIEFGFTDDDKFRLKVTYSLIVLEIAQREAINA